MHEFDAGREPDMGVARIAAELRRGDSKHGPEAFAAGIDQMPGELGDQLDIGAGAIENDAIDMRHVGFDKPNQGRKARARIAGTGKLNDDTQGVLPKRSFLQAVGPRQDIVWAQA
jgi:hypothetical protein